MSESDDAEDAAGPVPAGLTDAFDALGHETRLAIVEVLADERRVEWEPEGLSFSELRKAVGVRDAGKFNYHLDKLRGQFVYQDGDEYVLTNAGLHIAGAIRAGRFGEAAQAREAEIDQECPVCEERVSVQYQRGYVEVECPEDGRLFAWNVPPAAVEGRSLTELLALAVTDSRSDLARGQLGSCPHCWGHVDVTAPPSENVPNAVEDVDELEQVVAEFVCRDCGFVYWLPVSVAVAFHPAVIAYYDDRGLDLTGLDYLAVDHFTGANGEVVSEDPTRLEVVVATQDADEGLVLTLDDQTQVLDVEAVANPALPRPTGD
ncbi:ArsR/SmtB family transcription factor [Halobacteriales archaeon Cl-PHB]